MERDRLIERTKKILKTRGYTYSLFKGCFDIGAKKEKLILLKILKNIDSFLPQHSINLSIISRKIGSLCALIGYRTRREKLENDIIYERRGIPAITCKTLKNILNNKYPKLRRTRGGLYIHIDKKKLKKERQKKSLTQKELAQKVGVTKKNIYEHERETKKIRQETGKKIEKVLDTEIQQTLTLTINKPIHPYVHRKTCGTFEKKVRKILIKVGFKVDYVGNAPFNFLIKENAMILSNIESNDKIIKRHIPYLKKISRLAQNPSLIVTTSSAEYEIPTLNTDELRNIKSTNEVLEFLENW